MTADAPIAVWNALERVERLASAGQYDGALSLLGRYLDRGMFWHPYLLRGWLPSLAVLPAFRAVQDRMDLLRRAADATATARVHIVDADEATDARAIILLLHGGGGDMDELQLCGDVGRKERVVVAFVRSSQHVAPGKYGWVDVDHSMDDLAAVRRQLRVAGLLTPDRLVIGGYSQGGHLAIIVALTQQPFSNRGFIGFGVPTNVLPWPLEMNLTRGKPPVRGWLALGIDERQWRVAEAERMVKGLAERGVQCRIERIPGIGHAVPPDCESHLRSGIRFVLGEPR